MTSRRWHSCKQHDYHRATTAQDGQDGASFNVIMRTKRNNNNNKRQEQNQTQWAYDHEVTTVSQNLKKKKKEKKEETLKMYLHFGGFLHSPLNKRTSTKTNRGGPDFNLMRTLSPCRY